MPFETTKKQRVMIIDGIIIAYAIHMLCIVFIAKKVSIQLFERIIILMTYLKLKVIRKIILFL